MIITRLSSAPSLVLALALALPATARADEEKQIPFSAIVAPQGSISSEGANTLVVYLSWGLASGELPTGITRFRLYRDGASIGNWLATADATATQIDGFYSAAAQGRRKTELARRLCEFDAYETATPDAIPDCTGAALAPYEQTLGARLAIHLQNVRADLAAGTRVHPKSHLLVALATRLDPNVARARRLGHVDRPPATAGPIVTYRLEAVRVVGGVETVVPLGELQVDHPSTGNTVPVPAAADLRQVLPAERGAACDTPSSGLVHGTVALTWTHGGVTSPITRYYADRLIVGYDVYRSARPLSDAAAGCTAEIGALARTRAFDYASGEVTLPELVKVNPAPVLIVPGPGGDPSLLIEERKDLAAAGFVPGDRACYYVVPRDITGNYGPTRALMATVTDALTPPAPWDVEVINESTGDLANTLEPDGTPTLTSADRFALRWSHIDTASYLADHQDGRVFCNLESALDERRVRISDHPDRCADEAHEVSLDVVEYRVYRFDSIRLAEGFRDTDGDGVPDTDERDALSPTDPCDPTSVPAAGALTRHGTPVLHASWQPSPAPSQLGPDGRRLVVFEDLEPTAHKGIVYWYKIVPISSSGVAGEPSPAIRAFFPNEEMPLPPRLTIGEEVCDKHGAADGSDGSVLAYDYTCEAKSVRLVCHEDWIAACRSAWQDEPNTAEIFPPCRPALSRLPELVELIATIDARDGVPTEAERSRALGLLLAHLAKNTLWEAPFGACPLVIGEGTPRRATADISQTACERAVLPRATTDECRLVVQFVDRDNRVIEVRDQASGAPSAFVPIEDNPDFTHWEPTDPDAPDAGCWFTASLWENPAACTLRPAEDGEIIDGPLVLRADVGAGECIDINEEIQREAEPHERDDSTPELAGKPQFVGDLFRLGMSCDEDRDGLITVYIPPQENDESLRCIKASAHANGNVVSALAAATCTKSLPKIEAPRPPRLDDLTFDANGRASLTWTRPSGRIAGIHVEWARDDGTGYGTTFLGGQPAQKTITEIIEAFPAANAPVAGEIWCLRARSVGATRTGGGANLSAWTTRTCATLGGPPGPGLIDSIPWPEPVIPTPGTPLVPLYAAGDGAFMIKLAKAPDSLYTTSWGGYLSCKGDDAQCPGTQSCIDDGAYSYCDAPSCACTGDRCAGACLEPTAGLGAPSFCLAVQFVAREIGSFVVYRQERRPDQSVSDFVQVGARVDTPICAPMCMLWTGGGFDRFCLRPGHVLIDPDLALARLSSSDKGALDLVYVDRYPFVADPAYAYRYELVYFDALGEIVASRQTGWISPEHP